MDTLKSIAETYKALARVWYMWLGLIALLIAIFPIGVFHFKGIPYIEVYLNISIALLTIITCLAAKPSCEQKNLTYFENHMLPFFPRLVAFFIVVFMLHLLFLQGAFGALPFLVDFVPLWIFFLLFYYDSNGNIKQLWYAVVRAIKMTAYNLPLLSILMVVLFFVTMVAVRSFTAVVNSLLAPLAVSKAFDFYTVAYMLFFACIFKPIVISIWATIYRKNLCKLPNLYFNQPV